MANDLLTLLRQELKGVGGQIPLAAIALCRVFQHQLGIRDQSTKDLREDWRRQGERIARLEERLRKAEKEDEA